MLCAGPSPLLVQPVSKNSDSKAKDLQGSLPDAVPKSFQPATSLLLDISTELGQ